MSDSNENDEGMYEVEAIVGHRVTRGKVCFIFHSEHVVGNFEVHLLL